MTLVLLDDDAAEIIARVPQGEARREHRLRDLLFDHPEVAPVHDIDPGYGQLFAVAKELNIPGVGFIDVLLSDANGRLVVVECKLWRNPQARREVVGQILDYARELSRYGYEDLQRQISISRRTNGNVLYAMACEAGCTLDEARFVDRVSRDLAAGRFLLLIAGDGITEGTRRIGEYLRAQPGLAFEFGLVEITEYRHTRSDGTERIILQPRMLAQTAVIERHVIRSEITGVMIDEIVDRPENVQRIAAPGAASESSRAWSQFVERFAGEVRFDDPGQPAPRRGGNGWMKLLLPGGRYVNLYRSSGQQQIGAEVRFPGPEGEVVFEELLLDREAIDAEFAAGGLPVPEWREGDAPSIILRTASPTPWTETVEAEQRTWMARAANQFVNALRPRLLRIER